MITIISNMSSSIWWGQQEDDDGSGDGISDGSDSNKNKNEMYELRQDSNPLSYMTENIKCAVIKGEPCNHH